MKTITSSHPSARGTILLATIIPAALLCMPSNGVPLALGWLIVIASLLWLRNRPTGDGGTITFPDYDPAKPNAEKDAADFYPLAYSYATGFSEADREDVVQELVVKVMRSLPKWDPSMPMMSFVRAAMKFRRIDMHNLYHNQGKGEKAMNHCTLISQLPDYEKDWAYRCEGVPSPVMPFEERVSDTTIQPTNYETLLDFLNGIQDEKVRSVFCTLAENCGIPGVETIAFKPVALNVARAIAATLRKSKIALDFAKLVADMTPRC